MVVSGQETHTSACNQHQLSANCSLLWGMGSKNEYFYGCRHKQYNDDAELGLLADMLWYADMAYEGESERTLSQRLAKRGGSTACEMKYTLLVCSAWAREARIQLAG